MVSAQYGHKVFDLALFVKPVIKCGGVETPVNIFGYVDRGKTLSLYPLLYVNLCLNENHSERQEKKRDPRSRKGKLAELKTGGIFYRVAWRGSKKSCRWLTKFFFDHCKI